MQARIGFKGWTAAVLIAAGAAAGVLWLSEGPAAGQIQVYRAPRLPGTSHPDLTGIWQAFVTANWSLEDHGADAGPFPTTLGMWGAQPPGQSIVAGGEIPYRLEALAKREANFARRLEVDPDNLNTVGDPEAKCYLPGVPRATYMPYPFQIIQSTDRIVIAYQFANANRTIPIGRPTEAPIEFWMGWSNGHWDGDTLVVDVTGFHDLSWFDRAGNHHSNELHVVERYNAHQPVPHAVRSHDRGSAGLHAAVDAQLSALPARRGRRQAAGVQVRGPRGGVHLRQPSRRGRPVRKVHR